jgi:hypothetical protein
MLILGVITDTRISAEPASEAGTLACCNQDFMPELVRKKNNQSAAYRANVLEF